MISLITWGIIIGSLVGGAVGLWKKNLLRGLVIGLLVALASVAIIVGGLILGGDP